MAQDLEQDYEPVWAALIPMHVSNKVVTHSNLNSVMMAHAHCGEVGPGGVTVLKIVVVEFDLEHEVVTNSLMKYDQLGNVLVQILMKNCAIKHHANVK